MIAFTDGKYIGANLDRNGLRPSRYYVTKDDHVILSSEIGVLPLLPEKDVKIKVDLVLFVCLFVCLFVFSLGVLPLFVCVVYVVT